MTPEFEAFYDGHLRPAEGGVVDHDLDRGGATWYGISSGFLSNIGRKGPLSKADAKQIAFDYFWEPHCQAMDPVAAWCYCDALFNHSPRAAGRMLQHGLDDVSVDGAVGPKTLEAAKTLPSRKLFLERYRVYRGRYYVDLVKKDATQMAFLVGWQDRIHRLMAAMLVSGLLKDDLAELSWYKQPIKYISSTSSSTKANMIGGIGFVGVLGLFFPDLDMSSIGSFLNDPEALRAAMIGLAMRIVAKFKSKTA